MLKNDLIFECTYYGRRQESLGCIYFRPKDLPIRYPDILFFCFYALYILVEKKVEIQKAKEIQNKLSLGKDLKKLLLDCEEGKTPFDVKMTEYQGFSKVSFSSSMLFHKNLKFRLGYMGFGFFRNRKKFNKCSEQSVYGLLYTIYKLNKNNSEVLDMLWNVAVQISQFQFGEELNQRNYKEIAKKLYQSITKEETNFVS